MEVEVTKDFSKQFERLNATQQKAVEDTLSKLAENPQSGKFEAKTGPAKGIFSMRMDKNFRIAFTKNADGNLVPSFVGKHSEYDKYLANPSKDLDPVKLTDRLKKVELDLPDKLTAKGVLDKTSFSIGKVKIHGVVGAVITSGTILALGGTPRDAVAATTPGHVGIELAEGDVKGATEALVVDGAGDVGCLAGGALGAKGGAAAGAWAAGWGAIPGGIICGIGGCIIGSVVASETAQALWGATFEDDSTPQSVLEELKIAGLDQVPDKVSSGMSEDIKHLVYYKQGVADAVDGLNQTATALSNDPDNKEARDAFVEAGKKFKESADAFKYSLATLESPDVLEKYMKESGNNNVPKVVSTYVVNTNDSSNNQSYIAP